MFHVYLDGQYTGVALWKALLTAQVIPIITPWGYAWLISPGEACLAPLSPSSDRYITQR